MTEAHALAVAATAAAPNTVPLGADVAENLRRLQERTKLSVADLTNRAITSYEFLGACLHVGHDLIIRDARTGETGLVLFS